MTNKTIAELEAEISALRDHVDALPESTDKSHILSCVELILDMVGQEADARIQRILRKNSERRAEAENQGRRR